ncbi:hypothetical protein SNEBB_008551 [Seison nebaliae]|nr:hypothetical protein SNEBB_008551 [Seison nebaliae]
MIPAIFCRLIILFVGTVYPAYGSFKSIRKGQSVNNQNGIRQWVMYWIIFALWSSAEYFTDIFFSWLPLYYECKILFVCWLVSPLTLGAKYLYQKYLHNLLMTKEKEIDNLLAQMQIVGTQALFDFCTKAFDNIYSLIVKNALGLTPTINNAPPKSTELATGVGDKKNQSKSVHIIDAPIDNRDELEKMLGAVKTAKQVKNQLSKYGDNDDYDIHESVQTIYESSSSIADNSVEHEIELEQFNERSVRKKPKNPTRVMTRSMTRNFIHPHNNQSCLIEN